MEAQGEDGEPKAATITLGIMVTLRVRALLLHLLAASVLVLFFILSVTIIVVVH